MKTTITSETKNFFQIAVGILLATFGLEGFLLSTHFIDGGVTGVSMLASNLFGIPLPVLIVVINLPFILLGLKQLGRKFAVKSAAGIGGLALALNFIHFPEITDDKLLTAVFGGLFIGAGIGLAIRGGSVLDGTEIAALLISRKSHLLRVGDVILIMNVLIFLTAAFTLGVETAMYSILTYASATKSLDFLLHGVEEYTAINIISNSYDEIREAITLELNRGVTVIKGSGGMGSTGEVMNDRPILYCVVTRLEIGTIKAVVADIDPQAFITTHTLTDVQGGLIRRPVMH